MIKSKETYIVQNVKGVTAIVTVTQGMHPTHNVLVNDQVWKSRLAAIYNTEENLVLVKSEEDRKNGIYYCVVCRENPVDALGGYDTCPDCIGRI